MQEIYTETFKVEISHSDRYGRLKASELFRFMQECALKHAKLMGVGMEYMHKQNRTFVLSRMIMNVMVMPSIGDELTIVTYPFGIERLFYIREFEIKSNGRKIAEAKALWLVINLETRRPVRDRKFGEKFPSISNDNVSLETPERPVISDGGIEIMTRRVGYSDVDILGHANNAVYVAWACDCIGSEFFSKNKPYSVIINYSSELSEGECVKIIGDDMTFCGINDSGRESFSARIERL